MSRIGKKPIPIPKGVKIKLDKDLLTVKGPKGKLAQAITDRITVEMKDEGVVLNRPSDSKRHRAMHGLYRSLIANMIEGVTNGYSKRLLIEGVGYRAEKAGKATSFALGFSHPVVIIPPEGIEINIEGPTKFSVSGIDKQLVGQVAANIRSFRPPEPYKGKGIRYDGEHIRRKAGKTAGA
ncbi:MAG: 50S ribosomal protein L6 [candidate division Zixibacteria bacterium]